MSKQGQSKHKYSVSDLLEYNKRKINNTLFCRVYNYNERCHKLCLYTTSASTWLTNDAESQYTSGSSMSAISNVSTPETQEQIVLQLKMIAKVKYH